MTLMPRERFKALFDAFRKSAFRLQLLPEYRIAEEAEEYAAYLAGEPLPESDASAWLEKMARRAAQGKDWTNVHLLPERMTPYLRYLIDWGYVYHDRVGARILCLPFRYEKEIRNLAPTDFWLFDDELLVLMHYAPDGSFVGPEEVLSQAALVGARRARDFALEHAESLRTILARRRAAHLT